MYPLWARTFLHIFSVFREKVNADGSIVQEEVLATQEFVPIEAAADPEGTVIYMYNFYRCLLEMS